MPRLSLWNERKAHDYKFIDRICREQFWVGGTSVRVHKYLGPHDQGNTGNRTQQANSANSELNETTIQDLLWLENRDRHYDPDIYELRGVYNVQDNDFDLTQWGLMLPNDIIYIVFHLNEMVDRLGRKIMSGDVLELPHLRDELLLNDELKAINAFYKVEDAERAAEGFSQLWWPHIWRVRCKPLEDAQEFRDIVGEEGGEDSIFDILSTYKDELAISDTALEQAQTEVPHRNFQTAHYYVAPGKEFGSQYPWIFAGDGKPPNDSVRAEAGKTFPNDAPEGTYFIHTGYQPNILFQREGDRWKRVEVDWQLTWSAASRSLESFINNDNVTTLQDGTTINERQGLSKAMMPREESLNPSGKTMDKPKVQPDYVKPKTIKPDL